MFATEQNPRGGRALLQVDPAHIFPNPYQPRRTFDSNELLGLADSIQKNGILQPLTVRRRSDGMYELIAGERRLRAAKIAGLATLPCIEMTVDDRRSALFSLLENLQRQDLTFFEEADGIARLIHDWGITQQEAAQRLGKAQSTIANKLRLLRITRLQRERIAAANLTERHARALLRLPDGIVRDNALDEIIAKNLNVSAAEKLIDKQLMPPTPAKVTGISRRGPVIRDVRLFVNTISRAVDTMRSSGLDARAAKSETEDYIEYTVYIPKAQAIRR